MNAIEISGLNFSYSKKPVLKGLSLNIKKGEFVGVIGKTGCGKSTLLLTLNGIIPQMINGEFSGEVKVLGKDTKETPVSTLARNVAFVFQDPEEQIFSLSLEDEVLFGLHNLGINGKEAENRAFNALRTLGLEKYLKEDPHILSHGQKQKLAFACAIALDPEIYVLDEPVANLDYSSANEIYSLLNKINKKGKTIISVEHDTEWLVEHASRIILLNNGGIEVDGSPFVLFESSVKKAGIKLPCTLRISQELGEAFLKPSQLVDYIKKVK